MTISPPPPASRIVLKRGCAPLQLRTLASVATLAATGVLICSEALAQTVPRIPRIALPANMVVQAGRFGSNVTSGTASNPVLNVKQLDNAGILRWSSFDIGADAKVNIDMPSSTSTLLNKVDGGLLQNQNRTVIEGMLNANGQVYIYNPNGIIFGKTSQVNVNSLIGTTLKIDDSRFLAGLLAPNTAPIFSADSATNAASSSIVVEGDRDSQARITALSGGRILLLAPSVINNGILKANDGQVALAGGGSVYLASPSDVSMRGLLVEVSNSNIAGGSTATNDTLGKILVGRGNASLVGLAVNQMGTVSATTSVTLNGSIYLRARDGAGKSSATEAAMASNGGQLTLGENSVTTVAPTLEDNSTAASTATFNNSQIDLSGKTIHLEKNASVTAKGGSISVNARSNPSIPSVSPDSGSRIYLEAGSRIDASGSTSELAMESNVIEVELRGSELADSPLQRNSVLRGQTVKIDIRKGTPLANVSGYLALVEKNVGQLTAAGGNVSLGADGDVIVSDGASIDVSGGQVNYRSGYVATSRLVSFGRAIDIGSASPTAIYSGVLDTVAGPRNFEAGYSQGSSAGSIYFNAPNLVLRGNLKGTASPGAKQRDVSSADFPLGGQIVFGSDHRVLSGDLGKFTAFNYLGRINFGGSSTKGIAAPMFTEAWDSGNTNHQLLQSTLDIDNAVLSNSGFNRINAYTQGDIVISEALDLRPGGEVRLAAQSNITFDAGVKMPGGTIEAVAATGQLTVAQGNALDTAGLWSNDRSAESLARVAKGTPATTVVKRGGTIALQGQTVDIGAQTSFDVSGGAWQNNGKSISAGSGGSITIISTPTDNILPESAQFTLGDQVAFRGYGVTSGGTLKLTGRNVVLGGNADDPRDLGFASAFFQQGGFAKYDITAQGNMTVASDAMIRPVMSNWFARRETTTSDNFRMADSFDITTLPLSGSKISRGATSLSLAARSELVSGTGRLWIKQGASIITDPGAIVSLKAGRQLTVDGSIINKGGSISALLYQTSSDSGYRPERSIWLGAQSLLDVSGSADHIWTSPIGSSTGELLDGGNILIGGIDANGTTVAAPGYVVTESGAKLDVSGIATSMTLRDSTSNAVTRNVASAGGAIDIRAAEGLLLEGSFSAAGGDNTVSGGSLSLSLDRGTVSPSAGYPGVSRDLTILRVKPNAGAPTEGIVPAGLTADQAIVGFEGKGYVLADAMTNAQAGFDRIALKSQDVLSLDGGGDSLTLSTRAALSIDAPLIKVQNVATGGTVNLNSAYARLGNSDWLYQGAASANQPVGGVAKLNVNANNIDLIGSSVLQGVDETRLNAADDIRLIGQVRIDLSATPAASPPPIHATGSFATAGLMKLTASQIYPTTMSEFALSATGAGSRIEFHRNGNTASSPLSAAGSLTVAADNILQDGVLRAPFGRLVLNAVDSLTYSANSETSVAGKGNVPLGQVNNGRDWLYDFGNGNTVVINNNTASNGFILPQKAVVSNATSVNVSSGASIDLSGGGDLYAYEFTPGPGGSRDVLAKTAGTTSANVYAILPGFSGSVAPQDFQYQQDGGLRAGDRVYLSGIPGLSAGFYTLLPAHYALLKGAYSVALAGARDMTANDNYAKTDGTWVVAGYRGTAMANDSRWSGFLLTSSEQVRTQSEFTDFSANTFFSGKTSNLPKNGGQIAFAATETLALNGLINLGAAFGGRRGIADISAPEIVVVSDVAQSTESGLKLSAADLSALGAESLILGGIRDQQADGTHVTVGASKVTLANDAEHILSGSEIILAAKDEVRLRNKSSISTIGTPGGSSGDLILNGSGGTADGALLRVSGGSQANVIRDTPAGTTGNLTIEAGSNITASGSMNLDATRSLTNQGSLKLDNGAALSLGANRISLGDAVPNSVDGLRFDTAALTGLSSISDLSLTTYTTFDLYGNATLGRAASGALPATKSLSLRGAGIQSYGNADSTLALTADTVRFDGGGTFTPASATTIADGSVGSMSVMAKDIEIGNGNFAIKGFRNVGLTAQREIRAVSKGAVFSAEKALTLAAGQITSLTGANASIQSGSKLTLTKTANPLNPVTADALGGKLTFIGNSIVSDAFIVTKSGQIKLQALGADGVDLTGGEINASGYSQAFGSTMAYAPAGTIALDGGNGNVTVDAAATVDVSAIGADAGLISVTANNGSNGQAVINGTLKGSAVAGINGTISNQGQFVLDVDSVGTSTQFSDLNDRLNASGFTESRLVRVRNGDIVVTDKGSDADGKRIDSIKAHQVVLAAENGNINVSGKINASGVKGGRIDLYAAAPNATAASNPSDDKGKIQIQATALLDASAWQAASSAAGSTGDGGRIVIGTSTVNGSQTVTATRGASISVNSGAQFNVAGSGAGQDGSILLRAPRLSSNNDVAITVTDNTTLANASAIRDAATNTVLRNAAVTVEGYKVYDSIGDVSIGTAADTANNSSLQAALTTGAAATSGKMYLDSNGFLSATNKANLQTRLGGSISYQAGVEVRAAGNINVSVNETASKPQDRGWNLNSWRFGNEPGVLTLRAAGTLNINGSISDGFVKPASNIGMPGWALDPTGGASWSYRLTGGADLTATNPLATKSSNTSGDVIVGFARTSGTANDQPVALIRTGSGNIEIASGRDVILSTLNAGTVNALGATIYTAGKRTSLASNVVAPKKQTLNTSYAPTGTVTTAEFAQGGGAISIAASRDVTGAATSQLINNWLFRRGRTKTDSSGVTIFDTSGSGANAEMQQTAWWSRYDYFNQGIATFGGGDISVVAEQGNITDLSISVASNGQIGGSTPIKGTLDERGGGDLNVSAGGDIRGGSYYVQKGQGSLQAGGSVTSSSREVKTAAGNIKLRPVLALGDANIAVVANQDVQIESAFNPTLTRQSSANAVAVTTAGNFSTSAQFGYFSTYGQDSGIMLTALTGDVVLGNNSAALVATSGTSISTPLASDLADYKTASMFQLYPGNLNVAALQGDIRYERAFTLAPQAQGQLNMLAGGSVSSDFVVGSGGSVVMSDIDPSRLPGVYSPRALSVKNDIDFLTYAKSVEGIQYHTSYGLHSTDTEPVRIVALKGDISGDVDRPYTFILPKHAEILAGQDIINLGFKIQHLDAGDVTRIEAGRDFIDSTSPVTRVDVTHQISGPGRADIQTGRDFDLGNGRGFVTRGNLDNSYLPEMGAGINLVAGAYADYVNFFKQHVVLDDLPAEDQTSLIAYMRAIDPSLPETIDASAALARFNALTSTDKSSYLESRKPMINDLFFSKVRLASEDPNGGVAKDLSEFDAIIASLYPKSSISGGDINVFGSQLKTESGGAINLFAPGGSVFAGLPQQPTWLAKLFKDDPKSAAEFGITTIRGGTIQALVKDDFLVNQGRVFTLGSGDITLISQYGDIDAGKGAKTAVSAPPPLIKTDSKGNTVVDISASIAGSGIATLRTDPSVPPSNVYPIAPRGIFDAGDAGVRSSGTVSIVAATVLNAGNISAGSGVSGAPAADTSGLGGAVSAPANTTPTKTEDITKSMETRSGNTGGTLNVEVIGFGGDQQVVTQTGQNSSSSPVPCKADDDECKKPRK